MNVKEGDKVRVISRETTPEDRKEHRYYPYMSGLTGVVQNVYAAEQIAVRVDLDSLSKISKEVHKEATLRMRAKFVDNVSEIQRKELTKEEIEFDTHFMLLFNSGDLEKI